MTTVHALERQLLEQIVTHDNLTRAWKRVKANKGAAGVDAITVKDFPTWARQHWPDIKTQLLDGDYQPEAVRRVWIPKPNGDKRPLGIPSVVDRVIQQAMPKALRGAGSRASAHPDLRTVVQRPQLRFPSWT